MRIRGVGVDILNYDRFQHIHKFEEDQGIKRIFTSREIEASQKHVNPVRYFSSRFAAKEAILKSLGIGLDLIKYTDIEIYSNEINKPCVRLLGDIKTHRQLNSVHQIEISLSYEENCVISYAITTEKEEM